MTPKARQQATVDLRQRLWFLQKRLKDVTHDPALTPRVRQEKVEYYNAAIAEARARLLTLEGH